jgi:hypothetical protein
MEELAREFSASTGDLQRGSDILGEFFHLNCLWSFLKNASLKESPVFIDLAISTQL